jgi:hypothetical protein
MDNRVLRYITPVEQKILEGIKFYNNINESAYYKTDSYKDTYKTINIDLSKDSLNFESFNDSYKKIFYWEFSKLFYGQYGKPSFGMASSETNQEEIFKIFWSRASAQLDAILKRNAETFPKEELLKIKTALPKQLKNSDEFVNKLKIPDFSGFSEELKSLLNNFNVNTLSQYIKNLYKKSEKDVMVKVMSKNTDGSESEKSISIYNNFLKQINRKLSPSNASDIVKKIKGTFQSFNFNNLDELDLSLESLASSIFIDCFFYAIANSIISSKGGVDSETKKDSSSSAKKSGVTVNKRKSSTTSTNSQVSMTDAERLEIIRKRFSLKK